MIHGAKIHASTDALNKTTSDPVMTLEIDRHAFLSPSRLRRSMNTGMNVALATPPSTRSNNMLGTVFARLKASAIGVKPNTHASTNTRSSPVSLETRVPDAIENTRELCDVTVLTVFARSCDVYLFLSTRGLELQVTQSKSRNQPPRFQRFVPVSHYAQGQPVR